MTLSAEEIGAFVAGAQALLVNLGTFDRERREATTIAVETAAEAQAALGARSGVRRSRSAARRFRARADRPRPTVVRLNHAEFLRLAGDAPSRDAVAAYARANKIVVGLSGETDLVTDGERMARSPMVIR